MGERGQRRVFSDLTNKHMKRPLQLGPEQFEHHYKVARFCKISVEDGTLESYKSGGTEKMTKGKEKMTKGKEKEKIDCELRNGLEPEARDWMLQFPNPKPLLKHPFLGFRYESNKENVELDPSCGNGLIPSHYGREAKQFPGSLTHVLPLQGIDAASCGMLDSEMSRNGLNFFPVLDRHSISEDSSVETEELHDDSETDNADFSRFDIKNERGHIKSLTSNNAVLDFDISKMHEVDGGESVTRDLLGKSFSGGCSAPSQLSFNMGNPDGHMNVNGASNIDVGGNVVDGIGSEKACSCSFCLKAAFMWADLHYQDARGRLAALKKSRRHARSLDQRCYGDGYIAKFAPDNSNRSKKLEVDLIQHWKTLFLRTEDILVHESTQIQQSTLLKLKDLREECKRDLEMISITPSDKR